MMRCVTCELYLETDGPENIQFDKQQVLGCLKNTIAALETGQSSITYLNDSASGEHYVTVDFRANSYTPALDGAVKSINYGPVPTDPILGE